MASTLTGPMAAAATAPLVGSTAFGVPAKLVGYYTLAAALVINDVIQLLRVPPGAKVVDGKVVTCALDTATAVVWDLGHGGDVDEYIDGSVKGRSSTYGVQFFGENATCDWVTSGPLAISETDEDTIDMKIITAPTTSTTSGTIYLYCDLAPSGSY